MRYLFYILLWVVPIQCFSQSLIDKAELKEAQMSTEPIVVEFWADWNDSNKCYFLSSLNCGYTPLPLAETDQPAQEG